MTDILVFRKGFFGGELCGEELEVQGRHDAEFCIIYVSVGVWVSWAGGEL